VAFSRVLEILALNEYTGPFSVEIEFQGLPWPPLQEVHRLAGLLAVVPCRFLEEPEHDPLPVDHPPAVRHVPGAPVESFTERLLFRDLLLSA